MPEQLSIEFVNLAGVERYLKDLPDEIFKDAKTVFKKAVLEAQAEVESNFGASLKSRTGALKRSINTYVEGKDIGSLRASLYGAASAKGTQMIYTLMQEYGGEVVAKNAYKNVPGGPYLNIPTGANKTPSGVQKLSAREVFNRGGYLVHGSRGWAVMLKGGKMGKGRPRAMFALVKKVTIPAKLGMRDAAEDQVPVILARLIRLIGEN